MNSYGLLTHEYERLKKLRDEADEEWQVCLDRAEELHTDRARLSDEMGDLLLARGAILVAARKSRDSGAADVAASSDDDRAGVAPVSAPAEITESSP